MRAFHQVTTTDESGAVDTTLDINGWFLVVAGMLTIALVDSVLDGIANIRAKKYEASRNSLNS